MSPQEISAYKLNWGPGYEVQVDMDSDYWGKDFCRKNFNPHNWSFHKHTFPDDSHTFYFESEKLAEKFLIAYNNRNPSFVKYWSQISKA